MKTFSIVIGVLLVISYFVHDMAEVMILWRGDDIDPKVQFWVMLRTSYASAGIALIFAVSFLAPKNIMFLTLGGMLEGLPKYVFRNANIMWIIFFIFIAILNYYIMTNVDTRGWCMWKLMGALPLFLLFFIAQLGYFSQQAKKNNVIFEATS